MATTKTLIAELEDAVTGASPERRAQILKQMMDLFLSDSRRRGEVNTDVFDEIFVRLIERLDVGTVAGLGVVLSEADTAPRKALRQLAFHDDPSVAGPVLTGRFACPKRTSSKSPIPVVRNICWRLPAGISSTRR
jgi:uncharacterized protein (DUF2336 family)